MSGLQVGARAEVQMGHRWRVCEVVGEYHARPYAGTLFEGEPIRVLTLAVVEPDGTRGRVWVCEEPALGPVRLVEPGLWA